MIPKLFAFDLDGTLLDSGKRMRQANIDAIREMRARGAVIALSSGRMGAGVRRYARELGVDPALVILNGAEVYTGSAEGAERIRYAPLNPAHARFLTDYGIDKPVAVNFYYEDKLYTVKTGVNSEWMSLYHQETGINYNCIGSFAEMDGVPPSKIIFVGAPSYIDEQEKAFRERWDDKTVYVCRSWDHYLEFMNPQANKGLGLAALCRALGIDPADAAAYGDAENDIPMLQAAGHGTAMRNSTEKVRAAAKRVTEQTNEEDWAATEWKAYLSRSL
ncbi:MAG: Cof-type HAD-IIB family hydrolase [Chitinispirillia bacterium]|nr:Cof-type HAD-IIB family hydrolase [Chitinispirillia bacterium]MCL2267818.1 Cof-type HAD-IIB family hydrolase [Chitinispirillia bacterium]